MLSTLCVKENAGKKQACEDNIWVEESTQFIIGCICDGCSTGIKSSFASQLLCYLFEKRRWAWELNDGLILNIIGDLRQLQERLPITEINLLSTFIPFVYDKYGRILRIRVLGDGFYSVNGEQTTVEQDNTPDYIGYQISKGFEGNEIFLEKYPEIVFENVDSFIISSDGIDSLQQNQFVQLDCTQDPKEFLLAKPDSANCLQRRYNILKRNKVINSDDISIISYDNQS